MLAPPFSIETDQVRSNLNPAGNSAAHPVRKRPVFYWMAWIVVGMAVLVLGTLVTGRLGATLQAPDLPPGYLPSNPLPEDTVCITQSDEHIPRCSIHVGSIDVYFTFEAGTRRITRTIIPARRYMLGGLIAAWGTPTGVTWTETSIYVYWGIRSALLYASAFQPESRVDFILYDLVPHSGSTWRGFKRPDGYLIANENEQAQGGAASND